MLALTAPVSVQKVSELLTTYRFAEAKHDITAGDHYSFEYFLPRTKTGPNGILDIMCPHITHYISVYHI